MEEILQEQLNKQSPEVVELIAAIEESRARGSVEYFEDCQKLHDMAIQGGNKDLVDLACCYLGEAYCHNYDYENGFYFISLGLPSVEQTDEYNLICRCYNELGVLYNSQGGFANAQENYIKGLNLAREHRLYHREAIICHNFAALCEELDDIQDALSYRFRCLECLSFMEESDVKDDIWALNTSIILRLYCKLSEKDKVDHIHKEMMQFLNLHPEYKDRIEVQVAFLYFYKYIGSARDEERVKNNAIKAFKEVDSYDVYFDDCHALATYLDSIKDYENLEMVLDTLSEQMIFENCTSYHMAVEALRIAMYEAQGKIDKAQEAALNFFKVSTVQRESSSVSFKSLLKLRSSLTQEAAKNLFLSAQADTDILSALPNRKKLNEVIDDLFFMASKEGKSLGVEMLDIDHFKLVNDKQGHEKGDEVIRGVADVLRSISDAKTFVARYGGDEFVVYYYDMTDEEIMKKVAQIRDRVEGMRAHMGLSMLSVSQGIINHIPISINRPWDFMNVADEALYFVKGNGKDNARLVHSLKEITKEEWIKPFEPHTFD